MIILKSPVNLQSLSALKMYSDVLGEKIRANYRLIGTDITSEDLIHMTMQEPALFMNLENNQTLVVENYIDTKNALKLELANQLLNRIMLISSPQFTYQDEVFTASVLQKMGIMNTEEFIQQVRRHMEHNALLAGLFRQYAQYHLHSARHEDTRKSSEQESSLHNEILKRLMTADCNNIMYIYNNQINTKNSSESVRNAAWMKQANAVMLAQYREKLSGWENPVHWQEYMNYEIKPLGEEELAQNRILQRMAAAILENIIQNISYEQQRSNHNNHIWKDYTSVFYQSAADVIKRFQYFQGRKILDVRQYAAYEQGMSELVQDEWKLVQMLQHQDSSQYGAVAGMVVHAILENHHLQKLLAGRMQAGERFAYQTEQQKMDYETWLINEASYRNELKKLQESNDIFLIDLQNVNEGTPADIEQTASKITGKGALLLQDTMMTENYNHQSSPQEQSDKYDQADNPPQSKQNNPYDYMEIFLNKYENFVLDESVPLMENAVLLEQVNQHNLYMKALLESTGTAGQNTLKYTGADKEKIRRSALRAMENPQLVLNEIRQNADAVKIEIPEEIERILSITDEQTRMFYEKLLGYRKEETVIMPDSASSIQYSQGDDSHMISSMKLNPADRMIENAGTLYRSVHDEKPETAGNRIHDEKPETASNSVHDEKPETAGNRIYDEKADISYSSIHCENTGILYRSIRDEKPDILYRSIHDENPGTAGNSIRDEKPETAGNRIRDEKADILYRSIYDENPGTAGNSTSNKNTDISYSSINHENPGISHNSIHYESANTAYNSTNNDMSKRSAAIYAILKQIRENEDSLYQESYNSLLADSKVQAYQETAHIELIHKKEETVPEETVQYAAGQIMQSSREQNITQSQSIQEQIRQEQAGQGQAAQKQLQDTRQEHIVQLVSQNLKTQVHTISDMVYSELERRLKNEQRRRGY